jgi:putative Holliday junction resolvase
MDVSRARRAEVIDEHAAMFILQGAGPLAKLRGTLDDGGRRRRCCRCFC